MSEYVPAELVRQVRVRARHTCEYCRLPQSSQEATFHVDHILPTHAGGPTEMANLALACVTCSLRKSARTHSVDSRTKATVALFHPREDEWDDHFQWSHRWRVIGRTPTGRATIAALAMNRPRIVAIRRLLATVGRFPDVED